MLTATLNAHAEGFTFQRFTPQRQRLLENIVQGGIRNVFDFQNMVDTRDTGQGVTNGRALIFILRPDLDMIPVTNDGKRLIIVF
ncbi:Uncharacterised protein [Klebsiella grimontii]|nr:Uncharacterised protein [Klebsiella grimontii]